MMSISLFCGCEKIFTNIKIWAINKKFNETLLPEKEDFYSHLNKDVMTDADWTHAVRVCKDFEIKNKWDEYHDLYVQSYILLLADVFNNVGNMCLEIYGLDPAHSLSAPGLAWQAALKKIK